MTIRYPEPADTDRVDDYVALGEPEPVEDAARSYDETKLVNEETVVFSSPSQYSLLILILLLFAPALVLIQLIMMVVLDTDDDLQELVTTFLILFCTGFLPIMLTYLFVLPTRVSITSSATLRVSTLAWTHAFDGIAQASEEGVFERSSLCRPKIKFATDLFNRICVRRKPGKWDVLVSPKDPEGFLRAVSNVVLEHEASNSEECRNFVEEVNNGRSFD